MMCPWCDHKSEQFWLTAEHRDEAEFVHGPKNAASIARNPIMCPECHGVGGPDDFYEMM